MPEILSAAQELSYAVDLRWIERKIHAGPKMKNKLGFTAVRKYDKIGCRMTAAGTAG